MPELIHLSDFEWMRDEKNLDRTITQEFSIRIPARTQFMDAYTLALEHGVGVELTTQYGFNAGMVFPDSDIDQLIEGYYQKLEKVLNLSNNIGKKSIASTNNTHLSIIGD